MSNILHANARTTPKLRQEIAESKLSQAKLAVKYGLNPKTIGKWKNRKSFEDKKSGTIRSTTTLSEQEEKIICEFRRISKFSIDDVFICLKDKIPKLSRSSLYRCLKRNNLNKRPKEEVPKNRIKKKFKAYEIGFVHIDIAQLYTNEGKVYMFVAIDRKSRSVYVEIYDNMRSKTSCNFLKNVVAHFPFKIKKILTDNGAQFTYKLLAKHLQPKQKVHPFDKICNGSDIEHRLTKFRHPWTNGLVERMNRTIKDATVKIYFYETNKQLKEHMMAWLLMYNYQKKLKAIDFKSPYDIVLEEYKNNMNNFKENPHHKKAGLNR